MATTPLSQIFNSRSSMESAHCVFNWRVENFHLLCPNPTLVTFPADEKRGDAYLSRANPITSHTMSTIIGDSTKKLEKPIKLEWYLTLEIEFTTPLLGEDGVEKQHFVSVFLRIKDHAKHPDNLGVVMNASLIGHNDIVASKRSTLMMPAKTDNWGWRDFVSVDTLWKNEKVYLVNDTLRLKVDLEISGNMVTKQTANFEPSTDHLIMELCKDLGELFRSQKDADVTVHCGEKTFHIHSAIIKARSPVFQRMFEAKMLETIDKIVKIQDVDPIDFESFVEYLYTSKINFALDNFYRLTGLVRLADKYEVLTLKKFCFERISEIISSQNAGEVAVLVFLHSAGDEVRRMIVDFCTKNWSALVLNEAFQACVKENPGAFFHDPPN